jgi:hypothetical protein
MMPTRYIAVAASAKGINFGSFSIAFTFTFTLQFATFFPSSAGFFLNDHPKG